AGSPAERHHRQLPLRPARRTVRVPARADLHQPAARRRDQPGHAQDPERAAGGDVPGDRDAEPHRAGGDVSAARGPARPLPHASVGGIPGPRGGGGDPGPAAVPSRGCGDDRAGGLARGPGRDAGQPRVGARGRGGGALHRGPGAGDTLGSAGGPRRLAPGHARAAQAGARGGRAGPARVRAAGRREGDGGPRAGPPAHPEARAVGGAHHARAGDREPAGAGADAGARDAPHARMTGRVTPLALSVLTVAAWALALAVLLARAELLLVALPAVVALGALPRRAAPPACTVLHRVSADRLFEGDAVTVTVSVQARAAVPLVELLGPRPAGAQVRAGRHRAVMTLRAGQAVEWRYDLVFPRRGVHDVGAVAVRLRDRLGLRAWEWRQLAPLTLRVFPRPMALRTLPRPAHARASGGDHLSRVLGEGIEPGDVREFAPGDRIRHVNWRASLRLGRLYVTQRHRERNADVVLMLDTLAEVGAPPETTLDLGVRAAVSLATAYLGRRDRVGLVTYGGVMTWVRPGSGAVQYERLADGLLRAEVVFTYVAKDLARVPARVLSPQALVIAITPLLDPRFAGAVADLAARGFD